MKKIFLFILMCISASTYAANLKFQTGGYFALPQGTIFPSNYYYERDEEDRPIMFREIYKIDENTVKVVVFARDFNFSCTYYWTLNQQIPLYKPAYNSSKKACFFLVPSASSNNTPAYYMTITSIENNAITVEYSEN